MNEPVPEHPAELPAPTDTELRMFVLEQAIKLHSEDTPPEGVILTANEFCAFLKGEK